MTSNIIDKKLDQLSQSHFRSRFHLKAREKQYIEEKGWDVMESHARDFIRKRLAPKEISNDGKQTPMRGHPVFIAQHATATCCRGCLFKWYHLPQGRELTKEEQEMIVMIIMEWMKRDYRKGL